MGWAEKLPSGRYRGVYRDGTGRRLSAGIFTHKPKAQNAASAAEERARKKVRNDPEAFKRPWGEWAAEWWPTRGVEASTEKADAIRKRKHLDPRWAQVPIGSITRHDVKAWANGMVSSGTGAATTQRAVHLLSASLSAAIDAEVIEYNPAARIRVQQGAQDQERFLTREEYDSIREEMPTTFDQLVVDLLVHTGMRWAELAGLHRHRVDLERGIVKVVETYDETAGRIKAYPKGKRSRDIPLTPELVSALTERFAEVPAVGNCGVEHQAGLCRSPLVLATERGRPLRNSNWSPIWRDATARAGVVARPYDLRHTYASWLLQKGIPLADVGKLMGHKSTQTTAIYAHLAETPSAAVLAALAAPEKPHVEESIG
jgi:integrase